MEQQPHRACDRTKSKQKKNQVMSHSIVRFSPQIMQWYY